MKVRLLGFIVFLSGCVGLGVSNNACEVGMLEGNGFPCWVNKQPNHGVVVSMAEHVDPNRTRDVLFKKALLEIAAAKSGLDVTEDSIVHKKIKVTGNDDVSQQVRVITLATVKTTKGSTRVKAKIKGEWKHPSSRKLYLWVVPMK